MDVNFPFPFKPYLIQEKFMKELYCTIQESKSGIFESPTGTGKSLSICCSVLQWLSDHESNVVEELERDIQKIKTDLSSTSDSNDWLEQEYDKIQKNQTLATLTQKLDKVKRRKELYQQMKERVLQQKKNLNKIQKHSMMFRDRVKEKMEEKENVPDKTEQEDDVDLLIDEEVEKCLSDEEEENNQLDDDKSVKIFISSRTHSQLSQFVGEIKKTVFKENMRVVSLASRQHFCINPDVSKLKNINLINERCLDLQKKSSKASSKDEDGNVVKKTKTKACSSCPYYNQSNINRLKEQMLVEILDMEDLVKAGKEVKACPYYATRMALDDAQVVLISHAGIVSEGARSGISLKLDNNVLILDEAHGLTAALENAHSAPVSARQLNSVNTYLQAYINKYRARLSSRNLLTLNQMAFIVGKFLALINTKDSPTADDSEIFTLENFVIKAEIDHLNVRPLVEFCRNSRLAPKLHGFSMRYNQQALEEEAKKNATKKSSLETFLSNISKKKAEPEVADNIKPPPDLKTEEVPAEISAGSSLYAILDFLDMLCSRSEHGRVLAQRGDKLSGLLKYLLLNPAEQFVDVVNKCRSVIVAGGTMEPIAEFQSLLTGNAKHARDVTVLRCDHVVPAENVLGVCLSRGPTNVQLDFSYENRQNKALLDELGRILRNICSIVPGGVICFFPSYSYEKIVYEHLNSTKVLDGIVKKKQLFREPKSAADVDTVLSKYAAAVHNREKGNTGALLLSVVGGKLSEGLNFSDELGRCVVVVGMPYPSVKSPELREKMSYLSRTLGEGAGAIYYENLCMKAVNQCIGRALRHASDYAAVVAADARYSRPRTASSLPAFLQKSLTTNCNFGPTIGNIAKFFSRHKQNK